MGRIYPVDFEYDDLMEDCLDEDGIEITSDYDRCYTEEGHLREGFNLCDKCQRVYESENDYEYTHTCLHCGWNHYGHKFTNQQKWIIKKESIK